MKYNNYLILITLSLAVTGCTKLEEKLRGDIPLSEAQKLTDPSALLKAAYNDLHLPFQDQANFWAAQEHTTDEAIPPTRGGDWDDNGVWRSLHNHSWNADHSFLGGTFNNLLRVVFSTTNVLNFNPSPTQAAEAKFLRAFAMFAVLDGWGQVPFRQPGENLLNPPQVLKGVDATDFIISELTAIMNDLPAGRPTSPAYTANKDAARVLLMKCYLNKGVFANRENPTFAVADMNQVITLADQIITSGNYSLTTNFYDNFAPSNNTLSTELIFTQQNGPGIGGRNGNSIRSRYFCTLHYNQNPSGWNGFTTLGDFYDKFEATDKRRGDAYAGVTDRTGLRVGLLFGQQFDQNGTALTDRSNVRPLSFTKEVNLMETGQNLEVTGIRVVKYPPDYDNGDNVNNDAVFYRYADVLLMKAEAILRGGTATGVAPFNSALNIVNHIHSNRGAAALGAITLDGVYDERGRELYWESMRRQDMIRFGKFLLPFQGKPQASGPERLLFPIPNTALAVNENLEQNPGY